MSIIDSDAYHVSILKGGDGQNRAMLKRITGFVFFCFFPASSSAEFVTWGANETTFVQNQAKPAITNDLNTTNGIIAPFSGLLMRRADAHTDLKVSSAYFTSVRQKNWRIG